MRAHLGPSKKLNGPLGGSFGGPEVALEVLVAILTTFQNVKNGLFLYCFEPVGPSSDVKEGKKVQKRSPVMQGTGRPHKKTAREGRYFCLKPKVGQGTNKKTKRAQTTSKNPLHRLAESVLKQNFSKTVVFLV